MKVSVIIPVYNVEEYLEQCLASVCSQTLGEIEILCIDDGSSDNSARILAEYCARDARIKSFQQENRGVSYTRNRGLELAQGEYVIFWDSDDFYDETALEKMYLRAREHDADICVCAGKIYYENVNQIVPANAWLKKNRIPDELPFNRETNPEHILDFTSSIVSNKMYRRSFLAEHKLRYLPFCACEDGNFIVKALSLAKRITIVPDYLITYRRRDKGNLTSSWTRSPEEPVQAWIEAAEYLRTHDIMPEQSFANQALTGILGLLRQSQTSFEAFRCVTELLKNGALEQIGISEREPGYYYEPWKADCLHYLIHYSPEEFLSYYLFNTYSRLERTNGLRAAERERLKATLKKTKSELKSVKAAQKKTSQELKQIKESRSYRIGRFITRLPGKIKHILKG